MSAAPAGALPPIPPTIAQLTGPLFLGHLFNWGLFGALAVQAYIYYLAFPKDKLLPKAIVAACCTLELLQTVLSTRDGFRNFATGWGNMIDLDTVGWLWFSVPVLGSIICCMGQLFYAWRIWILSRRLWITGVIFLIGMVQLGFGVYAGAEAHIIGDFSKLQAQTFETTAVWLGAAAVNDIIIAVCMIFYLHRSNTGFQQTSTLLTKFIRLTVETGLVCATFAILDLSFYVRWQNNNYHLAPSIPLSKLYSNSLLVVLNARIKIVGGRNEPSGSAYSGDLSYFDGSQISTAPRGVPPSRGTRKTRSGTAISVSVSQEVHTAREAARARGQAVHIPMVDIDGEEDHKQKYSGSPLTEVPSDTIDSINKGAQLV